MQEIANISETEVNATQLAAVLGLTARRVFQLAQDGTLVQSQRGRYSLGDAVQRYITFISKADNDAEIVAIERDRKKAEMQIKASKAIIAKFEAEELRGKMHRSEDVEAITEDLVYTIRGALIALPGRLAVDCAAANSAPECSEIIRKEVYKVMRELAGYHYDPKKYEERVRDRYELSDFDADEDDE